MKSKHKIKAYTLSEVLVVLAITTIVISIALTVLQLVQKQMHLMRGHFKFATELNSLENVLWLDFNRFNMITYSKSDKLLELKTEIDSVQYYFKDEFVIRNMDTLNVNVSKISTYFKVLNNTSKVDAIELEVENNNLNSKLFIYKNNDAKSILD